MVVDCSAAFTAKVAYGTNMLLVDVGRHNSSEGVVGSLNKTIGL